ncbi:hypothetical protein Sfum_2970 [Syntrophobacter fumaroxidans MPOB]|uniref:Uncharacterized protein n=1 Tax=Syntrophobacter fumaroxidans (strain DSM 10017 / MPOB) TaxID=335543 RepID=A0LMJ2_SYNFM|nr:hypothetical protein Sfum_2970 [Syntrophobacter fumaroxidans MPOB]
MPTELQSNGNGSNTARGKRPFLTGRIKRGSEACPAPPPTEAPRMEKLVNTWGVCEFAEMSHDPWRRWDASCKAYRPGEVRRVGTIGQCCANCVYWLAPDETPEPEDR